MIAQAMLRAKGGMDRPDHLTIRFTKEFEENYALTFKKELTAGETVYVCREGSAWARRDEFLVLLCEQSIWIVYDSAVNCLGSTLHCRQPVYRCLDPYMTQAGVHEWQINLAADKMDDGTKPRWIGGLLAETQVP